MAKRPTKQTHQILSFIKKKKTNNKMKRKTESRQTYCDCCAWFDYVVPRMFVCVWSTRQRIIWRHMPCRFVRRAKWRERERKRGGATSGFTERERKRARVSNFTPTNRYGGEAMRAYNEHVRERSECCYFPYTHAQSAFVRFSLFCCMSLHSLGVPLGYGEPTVYISYY